MVLPAEANTGLDTQAPSVTSEELDRAVSKLRAKKTAPGLDGVHGRVWVLTHKTLASRLRRMFDACLAQALIPQRWKAGRLVLIKKDGRPEASPSAYRPIVLLDEVAKLFERVVATRLVKHLGDVGPDLAENQYGFRRNRSTVDAILRVRDSAQRVVSQGGVVLAVSLDIANAFNTLPWCRIHEALVYHRVPLYLRRTIAAYLSERSVVYPGRDAWMRYEVSCGVPQGSVLGPLLWNIGYDYVIRGANLRGVEVVCYADDTLVMARGDNYRDAAILATAGTAHVVRRIRDLGLRVAIEKSEAILFHGPRRAPPPDAHIIVSGVRIGVESTMKYLGLVLDSRWRFEAHFQRLLPRVRAVAGALSRIMPNERGPSASSRLLYVSVVRSMVLYGAPVWAEALNRQTTPLLRRPQRVLAIRAIRGYSTVSYEAACVLAGSVPWDLAARTLASLYKWREDKRARGLRPAPTEVRRKRVLLQEEAVGEWQSRLEHPSAGLRTIEAVRPVLRSWLDRPHGALSFRLTQVLTGHGSFGRYLYRVAKREPTAECHECGSPEDSAQHTLEVCPAWADQRSVLRDNIGGDLSLPAVIHAMVGSEEAWLAMASFCDEVMTQKEAAERERERNTSLDIRRSRHRRRRDAFAQAERDEPPT